MELNIKLIKIISGEEVVCNLIEEDDHYLVHKGISPMQMELLGLFLGVLLKIKIVRVLNLESSL